MNSLKRQGYPWAFYLLVPFCLLALQASAQAPVALDQAFFEELERYQSHSAELRSQLDTVAENKKPLLRIQLKGYDKKISEHIMQTLVSVPETQRASYEPRDSLLKAFRMLGDALYDVNALLFEEVKSYKDDLPPGEQAVADSERQLLWQELERNQAEILRALQLARQFELDVASHEERFKDALIKQLENLSAGLSLSLSKAKALNKSKSIVPEDQDIKDKLGVAKNRVSVYTQQMAAVVAIANDLGLETRSYNEQIILSTGQLSSDVFNVEVLKGLLDRAFHAALESSAENAPAVIFNILIFLVIVIVAAKVGQLSRKIVAKALASSKSPLSALLQKMITSAVGNGIFFMGVLFALAQVGVSLGPMLAGLGVAGFIIGFALQDSMSNFASGILILLYRPFDIDDVIETGGVLGVVKKMSLVNTTIHSFDNQTFVIPNNNIWQSTIKNLTEQHVRRVDLLFGVSYSDDIPKTEQVLHDILEKDERVLPSPEPLIKVHELGDSSVNFIVRPWVKTADYWDVYWDITRAVKMRFDEEGISIPFPQRDVHLFQEQS